MNKNSTAIDRLLTKTCQYCYTKRENKSHKRKKYIYFNLSSTLRNTEYFTDKWTVAYTAHQYWIGRNTLFSNWKARMNLMGRGKRGEILVILNEFKHDQEFNTVESQLNGRIEDVGFCYYFPTKCVTLTKQR